MDPLEFDLQLRCETLTPTFESLRLTLRGPWLCQACPIRWEVQLLHRKSGFAQLVGTVKGIELPCPACAGFRVLLETRVTFTTTEKRVEPTLRLESVATVCVRPLVSLVTPGSGVGFEGLSVYGAEVRCELAGYLLRLATSLDPLRDGAVTGEARF
ncbi:MAG: hypothetical protein N2320_02895 [Candidatus Bipolaricaulota bacterium]|nr:hypothetical protein [Candidatus Bipolaricaulota bacterium]